MAKRVLFKNRSGQPLYIEAGGNDNLTGSCPRVFDNAFDGHARLVLFDVYGMLTVVGEDRPIFYFRHTDLANHRFRFGNILKPGDGPLSVQERSYFDRMANGDAAVSDYQVVSDEPLTFGFDCVEPRVSYRLREDALYIEEGDFFSLKAEPWPVTLYDHQSIYVNSSLISQPAVLSGVLEGKPFVGLGSYDRYCMSQGAGTFSNVPMGYVAFCMSGIREDGRKEMLFASGSVNDDGKTIAFYYLDGETPVISDHFELEADWHHLPYVDDGTCVFTEATVRFCGKEVHFSGKWGTKGFLAAPRVEKHGQSQVAGTFYEGGTPYEHRLSNCWAECMEAYDYKLRDWGFDVVD